MLLVAAAVVLSGQAKGKDLQHLEVRSLTLKDKDGKTRAYLGTGADAPGLLLLDRDGKKLLVDADGSPFLALYDKDEKPRAWPPLEQHRLLLQAENIVVVGAIVAVDAGRSRRSATPQAPRRRIVTRWS